MARALPNDPIFYSRSKFGNPELQMPKFTSMNFTSVMPDAAMLSASGVDPGLDFVPDAYGGWDELDALGDQVIAALGENPTPEQIRMVLLGDNQSQLMNQIATMANFDTVRALRGMVGEVAQTVGFLRPTMAIGVRNVYAEPLKTIVQAIQVLNNVVNSEYFQKAVEGISWIPIVGWIIAIVAEILTIIANIAARVRSGRIGRMNAQLARRVHIPLMSADPDLQKAANEIGVRNILAAVESYELWRVFLPPHRFPNGSSDYVEAVAARDPEVSHDYVDENGDTVKLTQAWYLRGPELGEGMQPGDLDLIRLIEFQTGSGGAMPKTTGRFMVTARQMAAQLWQMVLSGGEPSLFSIPTRGVREHWDNYVHAMLEYNERCIQKGFTVSEAGYPCSSKHWCFDDTPSFCRRRDVGKQVNWPGSVNHFYEFNVWLAQTFWGRGPTKEQFPYDVRDRNKEWDPDDFFYENTVYATALKQLREQQWSYVGDYSAMLVHPAQETLPNGSKVAPFPSLSEDAQLRSKWAETVTRILSSPALWRNVSWQDVPEYRYGGQSPREILKQKWNSQITGGLTSAPPPMPGGAQDFPPPTPPSLPGLQTRLVNVAAFGPDAALGRAPVPLASRVMFGGAVAAASAAGGILLYNKHARVFFT